MKHTDTPWTLRHISGSNFANQEFEIRGMLGKHAGKAAIFNKDLSAIDGANICVSPEDAEFIVKAVNSHYPMIAALEGCVAILQQLCSQNVPAHIELNDAMQALSLAKST